MYLEHFKFKKAPFTLTPNTEFFCELPTHQEALNVLLLSLAQGEGFIKIIGEVGTGKTLLCRILLNTLNDDYVTAYIPNPDQTPEGLRIAVAMELGLEVDNHWSQHQLLEAINHRLLKLHKAGKKTILIIDEAQALPDACLEAVRLLTNLETEEQKLLQVVLFAQPELEAKLDKNALRQLKQRITFSYVLQPLARHELDMYLCHRLARAGHTYGSIFTQVAKRRLFRASRGMPRLLNILCHKALLVAYGRGERIVDGKAVSSAVADTQSSWHPSWMQAPFVSVLLATVALFVFLMMLYKHGMSL